MIKSYAIKKTLIKSITNDCAFNCNSLVGLFYLTEKR